LIWVLAYVRLCIDPTPRLPILFNWTASLPYHVALAQYRQSPLKRGDYIVFSFAGEAQENYPGLRQQPFFKQIKGLAGDAVTVTGRVVSINGEPVGIAKTQAYDKRALEPIAATVIPHGYYYVQGTGVDSFDSRYRSSGLVRADQVVATVVPLF
jgi:conjugal transfer pilin signal peptidase TrbI